MLIKATANNLKKYGDFAYSLALDPAKSCYPTYCDGIKTKADFLASAERALASQTAEILLFSIDGKVEGWLSFDRIPEDRYLQLNGFSIDHGMEQALAELLERLEAQFAGYTAYFGYPGDNHDAIRFLAEHGFRCIEQDWNHSFFFDGYTAEGSSPCVEKISRHNFAMFRAVYHPDDETYWNADRIFETIDDWIIFVYQQADCPVAAVFLTGADGYYEIYGTEFAEGVFQEDVFHALLTASLNECKGRNAQYLTYLCGERERSALSKLGFKCVGQYVLYLKAL